MRDQVRWVGTAVSIHHCTNSDTLGIFTYHCDVFLFMSDMTAVKHVEFCRNVSRLLQYEHENQLNIEAGLQDTAAELLQSVPEIRYEICHPKPLMAHRFNYDYGHQDRYSRFLVSC